jgi:hypothetical protein
MSAATFAFTVWKCESGGSLSRDSPDDPRTGANGRRFLNWPEVDMRWVDGSGPRRARGLLARGYKAGASSATSHRCGATLSVMLR